MDEFSRRMTERAVRARVESLKVHHKDLDGLFLFYSAKNKIYGIMLLNIITLLDFLNVVWYTVSIITFL